MVGLASKARLISIFQSGDASAQCKGFHSKRMIILDLVPDLADIPRREHSSPNEKKKKKKNVTD